MEYLLADKVPVLMGYSPALSPRPADWGEHVRVVGHLRAEAPGAEYTPPADLAAFLADGDAPVSPEAHGERRCVRVEH